MDAKTDSEVDTANEKVEDTNVSDCSQAKEIARDFQINYMTMKDAENGEQLWDSGLWTQNMMDKEQKAVIPSRILACKAVSREVNFSSKCAMENFRIDQQVFFQGQCLEEWKFTFGFVMPGSTNSWEQTIAAAGEGNMMPAELISGKLTIITTFFDGERVVDKVHVRVFYDSEA